MKHALPVATPASFFQPHGLWSLWEMYTVALYSFVAVYDWLGRIQLSAASKKVAPALPLSTPVTGLYGGIAGAAIAAIPPHVTDDDAAQFRSLALIAKPVFEQQEMDKSQSRLARITERMEFPVMLSYADYEIEVRTLREAMEDDSNTCYFQYYPKDSVKLLEAVKAEWRNTYENFESARQDLHQGVDCYASGHYTAAVFHFIRVAEHGLRAVARERSVTLKNNQPIDYATWGTILQKVEDRVEEIEKKKRGPARSKALVFYSGVVRNIDALKAYRDDVMHARTQYDIGQAKSVMDHVRDLMERISSKIGEKPKAIRWGKM